MSTEDLLELIEAVERDTLPKIRSVMERIGADLDDEVAIDAIYGLDEPEEMPLLFFLIMKGISVEALDIVVEHGVDPEYRDREGLGAVDVAIKYGREDILRYLDEKGVDVVDGRRRSGMTPLMLAASFNDIEIMEYLVSRGSDIGAVDNFGMSAIDYAKKLKQSKAERFLESL